MDRKYVLYGTGLQGEKTFWRLKGKLSFAFCIDRNAGGKFHGLDVVQAEEVKDLKDYYIIVAAEEKAYQEIASGLEKAGLRCMTNYIWHRWMGRELVVFYGNCHLRAITYLLRRNPYFCDKYAVAMHLADNRMSVSEEVLEHCKYLIVQDIREDTSRNLLGKDYFISKVRSDCKIIIVPNIYGFYPFFPQTILERRPEEEHIGEDAIRCTGREKDVRENDIRVEADSIALYDRFIEEMYKSGEKVAAIVSAMKYEDVWSRQELTDAYRDKMDKLFQREMLCDVKIGEFINRNRNKQLFYEPFHPTNEIYCEKQRQILKLMGISKYLPAEPWNTGGYFPFRGIHIRLCEEGVSYGV